MMSCGGTTGGITEVLAQHLQKGYMISAARPALSLVGVLYKWPCLCWCLMPCFCTVPGKSHVALYLLRPPLLKLYLLRRVHPLALARQRIPCPETTQHPTWIRSMHHVVRPENLGAMEASLSAKACTSCLMLAQVQPKPAKHELSFELHAGEHTTGEQLP